MRVGFFIRHTRPGNPDVLTSNERPALNLLVFCCLALVPSLVFVSCTHHLHIKLVWECCFGNKNCWRVLVKRVSFSEGNEWFWNQVCSAKSDKWIVFTSNTGCIGVGWWLLECMKMICQVLNKRGYGLISCLQLKVNALHLILQCASSTLNCITALLSLL